MPEELLLSLQNVLEGLRAVEVNPLSTVQFTVQWSAILLTALYGVYAAHKQGMDLFGSLSIAFIMCTGGGTLRDLLLGRIPVFWLASPSYALTIIGASLFGLLLQRRRNTRRAVGRFVVDTVDEIVHENSRIVLLIDALALGLWAYLGTNFALAEGIDPILAPILGVITASFGGIISDVVFNRVPEHFLPGYIYSQAAAVGSITYVVVVSVLNGSDQLGFLACVVITFGLRMLSLRFGWKSL